MKTATYDPLAGESITSASDAALKIAKAQQCPVHFRFNGVDVVANPGDTAADIAARWDRGYEANCEAYRKSPEGIKAQQEADHRREQAQLGIAALLAKLPSTVSDLSATVAWCRGLSNIAHVDVPVYYQAIADTLERAGYVRNEYVGHKPRSDFDTNPTIMGRWIVGQAIDGLRSNLPPHQVINKFADEYFAMIEDGK